MLNGVKIDNISLETYETFNGKVDYEFSIKITI